MAQAEVIQFPDREPDRTDTSFRGGLSSPNQWGGQTVKPYTHEEVMASIIWAGLEPMREGETIVEWDRRTNGGREPGLTGLPADATADTEGDM